MLKGQVLSLLVLADLVAWVVAGCSDQPVGWGLERTLGGNGVDQGQAVAVDEVTKTVYLGSYTTSTDLLGGGPSRSIVTASNTSHTLWIWVGPAVDRVNQLAVHTRRDEPGVLVCGAVSGTFAGILNSGQEDVFVARLKSNGTLDFVAISGKVLRNIVVVL